MEYQMNLNPSDDCPPGLETGNPAMDEQLALLLGFLRELEQSHPHDGRQAVLDILNELLELAATHFEDEEELMDEEGWPGLARHEGLHAEFLWKAGDLQARLKAEDAAFSSEEFNTLLHWMVAHIRAEDLAFFAGAINRA